MASKSASWDAYGDGKWHVKRGDCLWDIAAIMLGNGRRYPEIKTANGLKQNVIYVGQAFIIPGVSPGTGGSPSSNPAPVTYAKQAKIDFFSLLAGSQTEMIAICSYSRPDFEKYHIKWEYQLAQTGNVWILSTDTEVDKGDNPQIVNFSSGIPDNATRVKFSVKPLSRQVDNKYVWDDCSWASTEYNFADNPPKSPPDPDFEISNRNVATINFENIDEDINGSLIEISIYQDDSVKYKTGTVPINAETRTASYTVDLPEGHTFRLRVRAIRVASDGSYIYGAYSDFTNSDKTTPSAPPYFTTLRKDKIGVEPNVNNAVFAEWPAVLTAETYEIQYTTNEAYFDTPSQEVQTVTTDDDTPKILISGIDPGQQYFFRIRSINEKGRSQGWSEIKNIVIGLKPAPPTTWSNVVSAVYDSEHLDENPINLYWVHNSTDGSFESLAKIHYILIDREHPDLEPMTGELTVRNERPEEHRGETSVYHIDYTQPPFNLFRNGWTLKWKVRTAGVLGGDSDDTLSEYSVEREVNVYEKPTLVSDIQNRDGLPIITVTEFPFYFSLLATPTNQIPVSYYIEVIANSTYETIDGVGLNKTVNTGDRVYQKYFDPPTNAWEMMLEMTPANIDLVNGMSYTFKAIVAMNSGLSAVTEQSFEVEFSDIFYDVKADVVINRETLEANIHPYCYEYNEEGGELVPSLAECLLSVYRKESDGSFTEIMKDIENTENLYLTDPHPTLDYARYRVIAKTLETGSISYSDILPVKVKEPSVVIQWGEKWSNFIITEDTLEPAWSGSMIKIPYNIDVSENNKTDSTLVKYIGRKYPVSYYGTQLDVTSNWSVEIPATDKELIYHLRRLSVWNGNAYVREPNGTGYWANVGVSFSINHNAVTIPVTFNIKRVEGGM